MAIPEIFETGYGLIVKHWNGDSILRRDAKWAG
jgi:hypothetical protein